MRTLRLLGISVTLLCVLSMTARADEPSNCAPGSTNSPPCAMSQITPDNPEASTETVAPASTAGSAYSVSEVAVDLLQRVLSLF